jgi:hypothetical protein
MILKILRYNRRPESEDQKYWMFDNVRKYSLSYPIRIQQNMSYDDKGKRIKYDVEFFDMPETNCTCKGDGGECNLCIYYSVIICRMDDGSEYTIAFDTVCYVLNDNGKTIEKIVANY